MRACPLICHFSKVSGSSLPDTTYIASVSDQVKLQATVSDTCFEADTNLVSTDCIFSFQGAETFQR